VNKTINLLKMNIYIYKRDSPTKSVFQQIKNIFSIANLLQTEKGLNATDRKKYASVTNKTKKINKKKTQIRIGGETIRIGGDAIARVGKFPCSNQVQITKHRYKQQQQKNKSEKKG
jgi:hypothetical protein